MPMQGVTTQVPAPKSSTAYITALKKNPETGGVTPSLLSTCNILLHTVSEGAFLKEHENIVAAHNRKKR